MNILGWQATRGLENWSRNEVKKVDERESYDKTECY